MRKHNGSCWADFRPLSNVMVCLAILMRLYALNSPTATVVTLPSHQITQIQELAPTKEDQYFHKSGIYGTAVL